MEPVRRIDLHGARAEPGEGAREASAPAAPPSTARRAVLHPVGLPLEAAFRDPSRPLDAATRPLAALVYGDDPAPDGAPLVVRVPLPRAGGGPFAEVWSGPEEPEVRRRGPVTLAAAGPVAFAAVALPDADGAGLEAATAAAYRELLAATSRAGYPHLLRVWAVVPAINRDDEGLERYRRFCRARAEAMEACYGPGFTAQLSASTGVGSAMAGAGGEAPPLVVWALASRHPGRHRENPRQVAAWRYPAAYGPRSPSFARATVTPDELGGQLLISGTAAIVGHRSLHAGDVRAQTAETLANLARLVAGRRAPPGLPFRQLKVYLRRPEDRPAVEDEVRRRFGPEVPLAFLHAEICRRELAVEIEGVA